MIDEGASRLILQCRHPRVQLVPASLVRPAEPQDAVIRAREGDVVDGRHAPPHVDERLDRGHVRVRIDEPDIRRKRECNPHEPVLAQIAEVAGGVALVRKSSASIGRNSGSSASGWNRRRSWRNRNRASALAGESWKLSVAMWQSAHARPLPFRPSGVRSKNPRRLPDSWVYCLCKIEQGERWWCAGR